LVNSQFDPWENASTWIFGQAIISDGEIYICILKMKIMLMILLVVIVIKMVTILHPHFPDLMTMSQNY